MLPILHLNGYKIANPTVLARIRHGTSWTSCFAGYGYEPHFVEGDDPAPMHQLMAATLETAFDEIRAIQKAARAGSARAGPRWPMIVLRSPKGWTGPKYVDGLKTEGYWRAHQVPFGDMDKPEHLQIARGVDAQLPARGAVRRRRAAAARNRRAGARGRPPHERQSARQWRALLRPICAMPDFARLCGRRSRHPGRIDAEATRIMGSFLRDVMRENAEPPEFPRLRPGRDGVEPAAGPVRGHRPRLGCGDACRTTITSRPTGRVMEILSEHTCQGWLEGYLLTGRHGLFSCYEAFIHIVDSMFNQHAKWLKSVAEDPLAAADRLAELSAHLACLAAGPQRLQPPGSRLHRPRVNKKADIVRVYLPPDANTLL